MHASDETVADLIVVGSGAAALTGALFAAVHGLRVVVVEKTDRIGGTSAMSGAAAWIPANHHARAEGVDDSPAQALEYLIATAPPGWRETEEALWRSFAANAPAMLEFVEASSAVRFALTNEPDVYAEYPGGKAWGRMLSTCELPRSAAGAYARRLRPSTMPHRFTYHETTTRDLYRQPLRTAFALAPRLLRRYLSGVVAKGSALIAGLTGAFVARGGRILTETRAVALRADRSGAVDGVEVERDGTRSWLTARRGVLLASGGFEWDQALMDEHFPGPRGLPGSPRANAGDAIHMALPLGAALAHMDQALVFATVPTLYEGREHVMPLPFHSEPNAIAVNRDGHRFVSEFLVDIGEALDRRDPVTGEPSNLPAWLVSDARLRRPVLRWYARHRPGWIRTAPDIAALAREIGVAPDNLVETVARFNRFCDAGCDRDFARGETLSQQMKSGRGATLRRIEHPAFVAVPLERCVLATKGGLRTDAGGRVLHRDGHAIEGLYCAGAAMANPIGTRAISAGTTIGPNMTWGYICAKSLLEGRR